MKPNDYRKRVEAELAAGRLEIVPGLLSEWRLQSPGQIEPELLHVRMDLGSGRFREARTRMIESVRDLACPARLIMEAIRFLRLFVAHDAMIDFAGSYPDRPGIAATDQAEVAKLLSAIGAQELALDWILEAVGKAPENDACRSTLALIQSFSGNFEAARNELEPIAQKQHGLAMAHWQLAQLARQSEASNHVDRLRVRARNCTNPRDKAFIEFALFKELDDLGDTAAAWSALERGCQQARGQMGYNQRAREQLFAAIRQRFPLGTGQRVVAVDGPTPIFIVGMHRSGTTLVERILGAHEAVFGYGESQRMSSALRLGAGRYFPQLLDAGLVAAADALDFRQVAQDYLGEGRLRIGDARFATEKMPGNFQLIGFIRNALPQAKVIHVCREPMDLCFANLREYFVDGVYYSYSMDDVAHFHGLYRGLMQHWHGCYPGFVLDVHYENLVSDPAAESKRLYEFCGLQWNPEVVELSANAGKAINTLSTVQVRGSINTRSIGRWKPYAQWLQPLRDRLDASAKAP